MEKPFYFSKKFLNQDGFESDASIFTEIKFYGYMGTGYDCSLKIRDCHNSIHLTVDLGEELDNSIYKIDTIVNELTNLKHALISAEKERVKRNAEKEEKQKEKNEKHQSDMGGRDGTSQG